MVQRWRSLVFLHFACLPQEIQSLLPEGLEVDVFPDQTGEDMAWVGLVPFRMEGVRPRALPEFAPLSDFPETNVRTYVRRRGENPGVWFFSLDAANAIACRIAQKFFALPYFWADMTVADASDRWVFQSRRRSGSAYCHLDVRVGPDLAAPKPGSLEYFLVERYRLYSFRWGRLYEGEVRHQPYPLRSAEITHIDESLVKAAGVKEHPFSHVVASTGVDVDVFPLSICA